MLTVIAVGYSMAIFPLFDLNGLGQRLVLLFQLMFYAGLAVGVFRIGLQDYRPLPKVVALTSSRFKYAHKRGANVQMIGCGNSIGGFKQCR